MCVCYQHSVNPYGKKSKFKTLKSVISRLLQVTYKFGDQYKFKKNIFDLVKIFYLGRKISM